MDNNKGRHVADEHLDWAPKDSEAANHQGRRVERGGLRRQLWSDYGYLLITVVMVFVVFRVLLQLAWVPTGSMETTIPTRSLLISWRLPYLTGDPQPERGDVVTFWDDEYGKILVKRVIGLPGDVVSFSGGYVYINGERLNEEYLPAEGKTFSPLQEVFEVPDDSFYVLGDNRTGSQDSRYLAEPYVPIENIKARVMVIISIFKDNSWRGIHTID